MLVKHDAYNYIGHFKFTDRGVDIQVRGHP